MSKTKTTKQGGFKTLWKSLSLLFARNTGSNLTKKDTSVGWQDDTMMSHPQHSVHSALMVLSSPYMTQSLPQSDQNSRRYTKNLSVRTNPRYLIKSCSMSGITIPGTLSVLLDGSNNITGICSDDARRISISFRENTYAKQAGTNRR